MKLRRHLTYANVISTICLFLVLGGGAAFAATKLAKSSVGTEQLKGEAVTKGKLAPNSVNSKKVVNGSLTGEDIASSTLGKVPNATYAEHADSATTAGSANSASTATNASHATTADTAANAEKLDGHYAGRIRRRCWSPAPPTKSNSKPKPNSSSRSAASSLPKKTCAESR